MVNVTENQTNIVLNFFCRLVFALLKHSRYQYNGLASTAVLLKPYAAKFKKANPVRLRPS